ncbi:Xanthine dehydrogenase C subunit [Trema orientale]|uniref:Xanthine dehydrogenase C subunit n=1 Tax=Trema orientale TaxID=63057 RepID=A0A2P5FTI0_TREOI|nr:Xanthine dehydrogenase C subunit [Trema orientale]
MKYSAFIPSSLFLCIIISLLSFSFQAALAHEDLLQCLSHHISNSTIPFAKLIYTQNDPSYSSILNCSTQNPRFSTPSTPKPLIIVTPSSASHVQAAVYCCRKHSLRIRTRSGGHDFEGLSYVSQVPFVVIDLRNLSSITVDVNGKTSWVEAGANIGELYYRIAENSKDLGFPAGVCHTVGVGGHFSGGGYGDLMRKYGLAADNIIDARLVNADGKLLDRESMGEDLFWAIRGGGAASFGVVLAWKIRLLPVPSTVTIFIVDRNLERNETMKLVNRWQYVADKLDENLFMLLRFTTVNSREVEHNKITIQATFNSVFLGGVDSLLPLIEMNFPELGLKREDCTEMSWIESVHYSAGFSGGNLEDLLNRTPQQRIWPFKAKVDYVKKPIPKKVLETMLERLYEEEVGMGLIQFFPYGGKMSKIPASEIPFPHRAGYLFKIQYYVLWEEGEGEATGAGERHMNWVRSVYNYMTPYVSTNPRGAYLNYRDLDLGKNNEEGPTSYEQARIWGEKYFGNNFKRLVHVKTKVDPMNFFRDEQSIPPLPLPGVNKNHNYGLGYELSYYYTSFWTRNSHLAICRAIYNKLKCLM